MSIGDNIKKLREMHNLSQQELAEIAGVTDKAVSTWENNINTPRMGVIQKIADYFDLPKSCIIEDDGLLKKGDNHLYTFGDNIKTKRKQLGMTLEELANKVGVSRQTIFRYETGQINIPSDKIEKIANALECSPAYIMGWEKEEPAPQTQDEPTPEEIQFLLEEMRAGRGSKEASILYYGGKPKPADEKMLEIEKAIDRRNNLQSMAEKTAELILDGESPAMLVSYINDKWEQIPLTEDELKAIRILLQK